MSEMKQALEASPVTGKHYVESGVRRPVSTKLRADQVKCKHEWMPRVYDERSSGWSRVCKNCGLRSR